jgi:hypothetical protein
VHRDARSNRHEINRTSEFGLGLSSDQSIYRTDQIPRSEAGNSAHNRDSEFAVRFTKTLEKAGVKPSPLPIASRNLNGPPEKFLGTIKSESLSWFIVFGKPLLDYLVSSFTDYYNHPRPSVGRLRLISGIFAGATLR